MKGGAERPVRTATPVDRIGVWVGGGCGAVAAAGGFFVGFVYTLDQRDPAWALLFGALGLAVGTLFGLLNAIMPVVVLSAVNGRRWASATPLRALMAGVAAAVPIGVVNLMSDVNLAWLAWCTLMTAVPATIATVVLDRRTTSATRVARAPIAV